MSIKSRIQGVLCPVFHDDAAYQAMLLEKRCKCCNRLLYQIVRDHILTEDATLGDELLTDSELMETGVIIRE